MYTIEGVRLSWRLPATWDTAELRVGDAKIELSRKEHAQLWQYSEIKDVPLDRKLHCEFVCAGKQVRGTIYVESSTSVFAMALRSRCLARSESGRPSEAARPAL